jgi:prepilin-type N-terminal cleavage/methylation domain-containing protein
MHALDNPISILTRAFCPESITIKHTRQGFTLAETMMAVAVFSMVMAGAAGAFSIGLKSWRNTTSFMDASCRASTALSRIAYGVNGECGLRAAFSPVTVVANDGNWTITFTVPKGTAGTDTQTNRIRYNSSTETIEYETATSPDTWNPIGRNIIASSISATTSGVTIMVRARPGVGNGSTPNEMISAITFRNRG